MTEFQTVHDAVAAGRERLEVRCETCRVTHHVPWRLLPGVLNGDKIAELHRRLVCKKCGQRPAAELVRVAEPTQVPGRY